MVKAEPISIDVWQFVRIMVALEAGGRRGGRAGGAYATWRGIWRELDARLEDLGKTDPAAYADLMMEQQIVLSDPTPQRLQEVATAINGVVREMGEALERGSGDARHQTDLRFERKALKGLARRLSPRRDKGGKPRQNID